MSIGNAINEQTTGICGFTGTAFTGTAVTNHAVIIGGSTSSTLTSLGPTATAGQILQSAGSSSNPVFSTATYPSTSGTNGNVLTSDGTNWNSAAPSGGSSTWVLIQSQTASASSSINFTTGITNTYNTFILVATNIVSSTTAVIYIRLSTDGGSSYLNTSYFSGMNRWTYNTATNTNNNSTVGLIINVPADSTYSSSSVTYLSNLTSGTTFPQSFTDGNQVNSSAALRIYAVGSYNGAITVNALQVIPSAGTITSGKFSLYGLVQ